MVTDERTSEIALTSETALTSEIALIQLLAAQGQRFEFYQAVSLLERLRPDATSVGAGTRPDREAVRFRSALGFGFTGSDLASVEPGASPEAPSVMTVNFLGLAGAQGPLPAAYTQLLMDRQRAGDTILRDFLDVFNHRLVSLLYRARKMLRPGFGYRSAESDPTTRMLLSLAGLGTPVMQQRLSVPDRALPRYAGLLAQYPRSNAGFDQLLSSYFGIGVTVRQFLGRWITLEEGERSALGRTGHHQRLGRDCLLGRRMYDVGSQQEVRLGPLRFQDFLDFLPTGAAYRALTDLTRVYLGETSHIVLCLILRAAEIPALRLGHTHGARLGWTTWLKTRASERRDTSVRLHVSGDA